MLSHPVRARLLGACINLWPPFLAAGVSVDYIRPDFKAIHVSLSLRWFNRNYVGTHFGGSLYAMTDPFFMLMLIQILGPDYIIWDKAASIRFRKPGSGRVRALFTLDETDLSWLHAELATHGKAELNKTVKVVNAQLETVAEVAKTVYVRRKSRLS